MKKREKNNDKSDKKPKSSSSPKEILTFLKPYRLLIVGLLLFIGSSSVLNLAIPRLLGNVIDSYQKSPDLSLVSQISLIFVLALAIFGFTIVQIFITTWSSEKIARDLRLKLAQKVSKSSYQWVNKRTPSELLTNFTSDVDSVKNLITQGLVAAFSAFILLFGSIFLLLTTNLRLGFIAISILPIIIIAFGLIFGRVGGLFRKAQENLSQINKVINESVIGAALIRILNSQIYEETKFETVNARSKEIGYGIVDLFSSLIPIVNLVSNMAIVIILWFGGNLIQQNELTLGQFSSFLSYFSLLITPIFILGFVSSTISRSSVSLSRINSVLDDDEGMVADSKDKIAKKITGKIEFKNVSLSYGKRTVLKDISFVIMPNTRNAMLGPTAAGKTQMFSLITGLVKPTSGVILIDDLPLDSYDQKSLFGQLGLVFQDSILFNSSLKENILLSSEEAGTDEQNLNRAIATANLSELIESMPQKLATIVSERGSNLSGGQKQRIMLARALSLDPKILLLDDFTARVDIHTERTILSDLKKNYQDLTLISITQKIESIMDYDQILLFMEGELLISGKHSQLIQESIEYKQIWESQQTTEA